MSDRFFIAHGMIHDRDTGRHVTTDLIEVDEGVWDDSEILSTCELLNSLALAAGSRRAETNVDSAQCVASQSGGDSRNAPTSSENPQ